MIFSEVSDVFCSQTFGFPPLFVSFTVKLVHFFFNHISAFFLMSPLRLCFTVTFRGDFKIKLSWNWSMVGRFSSRISTQQQYFSTCELFIKTINSVRRDVYNLNHCNFTDFIFIFKPINPRWLQHVEWKHLQGFIKEQLTDI